MELLTRYTPPTKYDNAAFGTVFKVVNDNHSYNFFIQTSKDETNCTWLKMGDFLESTFENLLGECTFIEGCLYLFDAKGTGNEKDFVGGLGVKLEDIWKDSLE